MPAAGVVVVAGAVVEILVVEVTAGGVVVEVVRTLLVLELAGGWEVAADPLQVAVRVGLGTLPTPLS